MSTILDGKLCALELKTALKKQLDNNLHIPVLAILTVGNDPASAVYVRNKLKACDEVGIIARHIKFAEDAHMTEIGNVINELNRDITVSGIMLQLPLPKQYDARVLIDLIDPNKDVDGLTTLQIGKLSSMQSDAIQPCTPQGIMYLLDQYKIPISRQRALVIGRSDIVGKPVAAMLCDRNATVTVCHSKTPRNELLRRFAMSDIVVSAVGKADLITEYDADQYWKDWRHDFYCSFNVVRERVIIDVGMNRDNNNKLCGDFSEEFKQKYSAYYTPVPGGVGPMTVAMLMKNTAAI